MNQQEGRVPERIAAWKSKFHILSDWEIRVAGAAPGHEPKITTNPDLPRATFFPWPDANEPADFYFHEFMHLVLRAWQRLPADQQDAAEETLVRDISKAALSLAAEERLASSMQGCSNCGCRFTGENGLCTGCGLPRAGVCAKRVIGWEQLATSTGL